jgi:phosphonopyruvate decarboxylase
MIDPGALVDALTARRYGAFAGVPCSYLKGVFTVLERTGCYTAAPHEGIALALSAGHELAGRPAVVFLQNSGVGNLLDPLTSLMLPYRIPALLVVSMRGWPAAEDDEPHHAVMGRSTAGIFAAAGVETTLLDGTEDGLDAALDRAVLLRDKGLPFAILAPQGTFGPGEGSRAASPADGPGLPLSPEAVIRAVVAEVPDAFVVSTTGLISRELFRQSDSDRRFYMQGSMGHAIGIGLGRLLSAPGERVVVLDGDGSVLMHLGAAALAAGLRPAGLIHVVLDNGGYESTGGQLVAPANRDWAEIGQGLGYRNSSNCRSEADLVTALRQAAGRDGPELIGCRVGPHHGGLPRISERWSNPEIFTRAKRAHGAEEEAL